MMQNSITKMPILNRLKITGDISIKPVSANVKDQPSLWRYLIMGPTGAGKSSFIEALAGKSQKLDISKDQLDGYTQGLGTYQLVNVLWKNGSAEYPIYLVDTPGFSDTKISEQEIMTMVGNWLRDNDLADFDRILFLTPISEPRLAGSKRRTIDMLKAFLKPSGDLNTVTFVTTMWDRLYSERTQQRAESNFTQLQDDILKEFLDAGAQISQFWNTRNSALQILDMCFKASISDFRGAMTQVFPHLYQDLHERIESALQQKRGLESELADPDAQTNGALKSVLEKDHRDNERTLTKFIGQFVMIETPPAGYEADYLRLQQDIDPCARIRLFGFRQGDAHLSDDPLDDLYFDLMEQYSTATPILTIPTNVQRNISTSSRSDYPIVEHRDSPTSHDQAYPTRMLMLKGLLRRLVRAAKRRGKKWFRNSED